MKWWPWFYLLAVIGAIGTLEWVLLDAINDFQRLRHEKTLTIPKDFTNCFTFVNAPPEWTITSMAKPYQLIVAHPCAATVEVQ